VSKVITKEMSIIDIVENHPQTVEVFQNYGMGCIGCMASRFENVEQGAIAHGIDIDSLIKDLNSVVTK
jgi:hybrid cluster-associated redox disulfide protein